MHDSCNSSTYGGEDDICKSSVYGGMVTYAHMVWMMTYAHMVGMVTYVNNKLFLTMPMITSLFILPWTQMNRCCLKWTDAGTLSQTTPSRPSHCN